MWSRPHPIPKSAPLRILHQVESSLNGQKWESKKWNERFRMWTDIIVWETYRQSHWSVTRMSSYRCVCVDMQTGFAGAWPATYLLQVVSCYLLLFSRWFFPCDRLKIIHPQMTFITPLLSGVYKSKSHLKHRKSFSVFELFLFLRFDAFYHRTFPEMSSSTSG